MQLSDATRPCPGDDVPCRCIPASEMKWCTSSVDCRDRGGACASLSKNETVDRCDDGDKCICIEVGNPIRSARRLETDGNEGHYEQCHSKRDCGESPCVNMDTMEEEESCSGDDCMCIPCFFGAWMKSGCQRFETVTSACRGALLSNVSEVCMDSCKVVLPAWLGKDDYTCEGYCGAHNLTCAKAGMAHHGGEDSDASLCNATHYEYRECRAPVEEGTICECKGMNMQRRVRPGPDHDLVDHCMQLLDSYETCIYDHPALHEQMPDPRIRRAMERERNQKCIDIHQDVFDKYNVVGCSARR